MRRTYFKNVNTGNLMTEKEYYKMLEREAKEGWNELSDEDKEEYGSFEIFLEQYSECDRDFIECYANGKPID